MAKSVRKKTQERCDALVSWAYDIWFKVKRKSKQKKRKSRQKQKHRWKKTKREVAMHWCLVQGRTLSEYVGGRFPAAVIFVQTSFSSSLFVRTSTFSFFSLTSLSSCCATLIFIITRFMVISSSWLVWYLTFDYKFWEETKISSDSEFMFLQS